MLDRASLLQGQTSFMQCSTDGAGSSPALALTPSLSGEGDTSLAQESSPRTYWPDWDSLDDSCSDITTEERLGVARAQLAELLQERDALHAANAALQALADTSAHIISLLSAHNLNASAGPSSRLGGCPSTRAVAEIFRVSLKGLQPPETAYAAFGHVNLDLYMDLDVDFRAGLGRALSDWTACQEINERRQIEHALANAITVREKARWYIFTLSPKAALHYWRTITATAEDVEARRAKQMSALGAMQLAPKQVEGVRKAWKTFCADMKAVEAARKDAEHVLIQPGVHEAQTLRTAADGGMTAAAVAAAMETLAHRQLMVYDALMRGVVAALTWAQAAMLAATMSPYSADFVELCNDILFMGPKFRR